MRAPRELARSASDGAIPRLRFGLVWKTIGGQDGLALALGRAEVDVLPIENRLGQVDHGDAPVHGAALQAAKGIGLGPAMALHEDALGPLDGLVILDGLLQA